MEDIYNNVKEEPDDNFMEETDDYVMEETDDNVMEETDNNVMEETDNNVMEETDNNVMEETDNIVMEETHDYVIEDTDDNVMEETDYNVMEETDENVIETHFEQHLAVKKRKRKPSGRVTVKQRQLVQELVAGDIILKWRMRKKAAVPEIVVNHWNEAAEQLNALQGSKKTGAEWRKWYARDQLSRKNLTLDNTAEPADLVEEQDTHVFDDTATPSFCLRTDVLTPKNAHIMGTVDVPLLTKHIEAVKNIQPTTIPESLKTLVSTLQNIKSNNVVSDLRLATIYKLSILLCADDNHNRLIPTSRMTITDWLLFDTVLVHQNIDFVHMNNSTMVDQPVLVHLFNLVQAYNIEELEGEPLAEAWAALTMEYNKYGRMCTPMLLQRRWYQLKVTTRDRFFQFQEALISTPESAALIESKKPTPLQTKIAQSFKWLLDKPFVTWEELIKQKRVILRDQFESIAMNKRMLKVTCTTPNIVTQPAPTPIKTYGSKTVQQSKPIEFETVTIPETNQDVHINEDTLPEKGDKEINPLPDENLDDIESQLPYNTIAVVNETEPLPKITNIFGNVQMPIEKLPEIGMIVDKMANVGVVSNATISVVTNSKGSGNRSNLISQESTENVVKDKPICAISSICQLNTEVIDTNNAGQIAENDIRQKADENLFKVLRVETVKLDDMGILPMHCLKHVNIKEIIELIEFKSKVKRKTVNTGVSNKVVNDSNNVESISVTNNPDLNNKTVDSTNVEVTDNFVDVSNKMDIDLGSVKTEPETDPMSTSAGNKTVTSVGNETVIDVMDVDLTETENNQLISCKDVDVPDKTSTLPSLSTSTSLLYNLLTEIQTEVNSSFDNTEIDQIDDPNIQAMNKKSIKPLQLSNILFKRPRIKHYEPKQLLENPDFNISIRKKNLTEHCHQMWQRFCKPVTIDVSRAFEKRLIKGKLFLDPGDNKLNKKTPVIPAAKNLIDESTNSNATVTSVNQIPTTSDHKKICDDDDDVILVKEVLAPETIDLTDTPHTFELINSNTAKETSLSQSIINPSEDLLYFNDKSNIDSIIDTKTLDEILNTLNGSNNSSTTTLVNVNLSDITGGQNNYKMLKHCCWARYNLQCLKLGHRITLSHNCIGKCNCCCKNLLAVYCVNMNPNSRAAPKADRITKYIAGPPPLGPKEPGVEYVYINVSPMPPKESVPDLRPIKPKEKKQTNNDVANITDILEQCLDPSRDKYLYLGRNKILFTTANVPKNFAKFRNFIHHVNNTFVIPKGVKFSLTNNGKIVFDHSCKLGLYFKGIRELNKLIDNFNKNKPPCGSVGNKFKTKASHTAMNKPPPKEKDKISSKIEACLGRLLSRTLTPIKLLSELKYAYSQNGIFLKLDLDKKKLVPINVYLKGNNVQKIKQVELAPKEKGKSKCTVSKPKVTKINVGTSMYPNYPMLEIRPLERTHNVNATTSMTNNDNVETKEFDYEEVSIKPEPEFML